MCGELYLIMGDYTYGREFFWVLWSSKAAVSRSFKVRKQTESCQTLGEKMTTTKIIVHGAIGRKTSFYFAIRIELPGTFVSVMRTSERGLLKSPGKLAKMREVKTLMP